MNAQNDHDLLIVLQTQFAVQMDAQNRILNDLVSKISELSGKFDALRDEQRNHGERIKAMERGLSNNDIRIASLEQKVDSMQDGDDQRAAVQEALLNASKKRDQEHEKSMRAWAFIFGAVSFCAAMIPQLATLAQKFFAP